MNEYLESVLSGNGFMPHGHCYLWTPGLVWLHVISDALIVLAYFSIPIALVYFVRHRKDFSFAWIFVSFAIFTLACGTTHLMEIWNVWHSHYWLSGGIKALTAAASVPTAILLARLVPAALALPSPAMLARANVALEAEIQSRRAAEETVSELNVGLEARVAERTADLKAANEDLLRQIAEREQAEQALRESEERFRSYFELGLIGAAITSPTKGWIEVNDEICSMLGYERSELLRMSWAELTHPDDLIADVAHFNRVLAAELDGYSMDKRFIRKDGRVIHATISVKCRRRTDGSVDYFMALLQDITERKQAEEKLWQSLQLLRAITEGTTDAIFAKDREGRYLMINTAGARFVGKKPEEMIGLDDTQCFSPETRTRIVERDQAIMRTGETRTDEDTSTTLAGISRVHSTTKGPLRDSAGAIIGLFGVSRDITERKGVEQSQKESQVRYETLVQTIDGIVWEADPKTFMFTFVSKQAERILGYPLEQWFEGPNFWPDQMHPDDRDWAVKFCVDSTARGEDHQFEYRMISADGRVVWLNDIVSLHIADDQSVILRGLMVDITERKQSEEALRETKERFRELAENINEVFWVWTAPPGNARCLYVSPAYETIWGRSCESLYSSPQSWMEALHPQDQARVHEEGARMDFEKITDWTYRIVRPDQSVRWIRDRIFPVREVGGAVVRFAGIAQDITESKEAEEAVRKANRQLRNLSRRRIQEQEDERRRLSRELHDQIGQSLTAAKINVEALRSTTSPALVGRLDETTAILDELLGQVRQISLDLRPPMLDDLGLVPALRSFIDEQGRRASVAVRFSAEQIPEKLDPEIQITCFRIAQEAITNAVRHAKATQLDIALRCARGKHLRLLARDNGIGFDAEATQAQAVDLGLIGIKERAALVGGRAKIISSPREGTTIDVSLPLSFRPERQARPM